MTYTDKIRITHEFINDQKGQIVEYIKDAVCAGIFQKLSQDQFLSCVNIRVINAPWQPKEDSLRYVERPHLDYLEQSELCEVVIFTSISPAHDQLKHDDRALLLDYSKNG